MLEDRKNASSFLLLYANLPVAERFVSTRGLYKHFGPLFGKNIIIYFEV